MTDTPETDGEWNRLACQDLTEFERNLADFARKLERERDKYQEQADALVERLGSTQVRMIDAERERDEARVLCRWAFPRLRAMCHDYDATGTGWCCADEMESHPEIFSAGRKSPCAGATEMKS